ncbi:hypothetical protein EN742_18400 [Mesorhizobium sp. M4A.F.Ca.ET.020.02.1.1]|uniref:hypothetical protein n=1 Tax=unclassified Mesorhizobium TaxID=325217 RepID=UPI000FD49C52|nr:MULTISPECIES: hypothetical protein [unclassified Mesorhizobium]RVD38155.1 hypothetical protein EN742_18400 [Mesorhizobium sp. M4A.F.Ca.ET.020.02.1.1]RWC17078.1 MAG: hypothetical protein EOS53_19130 [Mesorhizobium sp.]
MNAVLGNPMVTTAALPLVLGIALGFVGRASTLSAWPAAVLTWAAAAIFFYWDIMGAPVLWPTAASQKLIYLALLGAAFALSAENNPNLRVQAGGAALLIVVALLWLSWRKLLSGVDLQLATAAVVALLIAAGLVALLWIKGAAPSAQTEKPFLFPAAVLSVGFAGAITSVLAASIVVGQLLGSLAALTGGYCLFGFIEFLVARRSSFGWRTGTAILMLLCVAFPLIQTSLLAPKINHVAALLATMPPLVAWLVSGRLQFLLPSARAPRPLAAGFLIAVPAILAVLIALVWAPQGAQLGF